MPMYTHARKYSHPIPLSVVIHMHSYCFFFFCWLLSLVMVMSDFWCSCFFHSLLFLFHCASFIRITRAVFLILSFQYVLLMWLSLLFGFFGLFFLFTLDLHQYSFRKHLLTFSFIHSLHRYAFSLTYSIIILSKWQRKAKWRRNIWDENHIYKNGDIEIEKWCIATIWEQQ